MKGRMEGREEAFNEGVELDPRETKIKEFENDGIRYHTEDIEDRLRTSYPNLDASAVKKYIDSYLEDLENNTDIDNIGKEYDYDKNEKQEYTQEELNEIWDNDPGYVNERVMKELPSYDEETGELLSDKYKIISDIYLKEGLHVDVIDWGPESVPGTEKRVELEQGTVLVRWGNEAGHFATPEGTEYEDLQLPTSEDKREKNEYVVLKSFGGADSDIVKQSEIATQNWNKQDGIEQENENTEARPIQYKFSKSIEELLKEGYLAKLDN